MNKSPRRHEEHGERKRFNAKDAEVRKSREAQINLNHTDTERAEVLVYGNSAISVPLW